MRSHCFHAEIRGLSEDCPCDAFHRAAEFFSASPLGVSLLFPAVVCSLRVPQVTVRSSCFPPPDGLHHLCAIQCSSVSDLLRLFCHVSDLLHLSWQVSDLLHLLSCVSDLLDLFFALSVLLHLFCCCVCSVVAVLPRQCSSVVVLGDLYFAVSVLFCLCSAASARLRQ